MANFVIGLYKMRCSWVLSWLVISPGRLAYTRQPVHYISQNVTDLTW